MPQDIRKVLKNVFRSQAEPNQFLTLFTDFVDANEGVLSKSTSNKSVFVQERRLGFPTNYCGAIQFDLDSPQLERQKKLQEEVFERKFDAKQKEKISHWDSIFSAHGGIEKPLNFQKYGQRIRKTIRQYGIPSIYRPKVWLEASGAAKKFEENKGYYQAMIQSGNYRQDTDAERQIDLDLSRTFPQHPYFKDKTGEGIVKLKRVLATFARRNPFIAYCQSFNFIVGMLLLHFDEEETFWMLVIILEDILPADYYNPVLKGVRADVKVLDSLIEFYLPRIYKKFSELHMDTNAIASKWFMTLFVDVFPLETALRIWDIFFHEGSKTLFRVALGFLKMNESAILRCKHLGKVLTFCSIAPSTIFDVDALLASSFSFFQIRNLSISRKRIACGFIIDQETNELMERRKARLEKKKKSSANDTEIVHQTDKELNTTFDSNIQKEILDKNLHPEDAKHWCDNDNLTPDHSPNINEGDFPLSNLVVNSGSSESILSNSRSYIELYAETDSNTDTDISSNSKKLKSQKSLLSLSTTTHAFQLYSQLLTTHKEELKDKIEMDEILRQHQDYIITNQYSIL